MNNNGASWIGTIIWLVIVVFIVLDVWKSPAPTGKKALWTIFPLFCSLVALIVYLVWGRKDAWNGTPGNTVV